MGNFDAPPFSRLRTRTALILFGVVVSISGCLRFKTDLGKLPASGYRTINHDAMGEISDVELTQATVVEDLALPAGTKVRLDDHFKDIASVFVKDGIVVHGIAVPPSSRIEFDVPAGQTHTVKAVELGADMRYGGVAFLAGDNVRFTDGGGLSSARLHGPHSFGDKRYPADADVWFDEGGEVTRVLTKGERARIEAAERACNTRCATVIDSNQHSICMTRCSN